MAGFAQIYSTAVIQPAEVILPSDQQLSEHLDADAKDAEIGTGVTAEPLYNLDDDITQEQAMPEGPTVSKWEEWAYVSQDLLMVIMAEAVRSTSTTMVTAVSDPSATLRRCFSLSSIKQDTIQSQEQPVLLVPVF